MADEDQTQPTPDAATSNQTKDSNSNKYSGIVITGGTINAENIAVGDANTIISILSIAASISSITQVILMIADLRSRKANKKAEPPSDRNIVTTITHNGTDWKSLKEIKVQMSDGSQVQIDSWLHDPKKIKEFLEIYSLQSASPRPEKVVFVFNNGSRIPLTVSNNPGSKEELDTVLKYLQLE